METSSKIEKKIDTLSKATVDRFDIVDTKYGKISYHLENISGYMEEGVNVLRSKRPKQD